MGPRRERNDLPVGISFLQGRNSFGSFGIVKNLKYLGRKSLTVIQIFIPQDGFSAQQVEVFALIQAVYNFKFQFVLY